MLDSYNSILLLISFVTCYVLLFKVADITLPIGIRPSEYRTNIAIELQLSDKQHWTFDCTVSIGLSELSFLCYRPIGIPNIGLANSKNFRTNGYRIKTSIYRTIGHRTLNKTIGCLAL